MTVQLVLYDMAYVQYLCFLNAYFLLCRINTAIRLYDKKMSKWPWCISSVCKLKF
jgi:hypothetical protein